MFFFSGSEYPPSIPYGSVVALPYPLIGGLPAGWKCEAIQDVVTTHEVNPVELWKSASLCACAFNSGAVIIMFGTSIGALPARTLLIVYVTVTFIVGLTITFPVTGLYLIGNRCTYTLVVSNALPTL